MTNHVAIRPKLGRHCISSIILKQIRITNLFSLIMNRRRSRYCQDLSVSLIRLTKTHLFIDIENMMLLSSGLHWVPTHVVVNTHGDLG